LKWVTREKAKVDRIACPWLIKSFVDPQAEFLFVPPEKVLQVAKEKNAIPFDVQNVELGHHGEECTFDAIVRKYGLTNPELRELAEVVRGADTANINLTPESPGLKAIAEGFRLISKDDFENMTKQFPVYDALHAYLKNRAKQA